MNPHKMGVAILGCGLIGQKRAKTINPAQLIICADPVLNRAQALAQAYPGTEATNDWKQAIDRSDVDLVIVATTNNALAETSLYAVQAGKHVQVEKPAARHSHELTPVIEAANLNNVQVRVGFNHRYHPAMKKAKALVDLGEIGELMFIRGRYGHGGRLGYEKEWRANPNLSGGGELLDQGVHLIDLSRWFMGDFSEVSGFAHTFFWDMPVDDNGFMLLKTARQQTAFLHVSCTEWKNLFSMELYGKSGKLQIDGLGGSYGVERLTFYKMLPAMGPPDTIIWEFPRGDNSWELEFKEFIEDIQLQRLPAANLYDAKVCLEIVEKIYQDSGYDHFS